MSWDVMVFNLAEGAPKNLGEWPTDYQPPPLGPASEVRAAISNALPGVEWSTPHWGRYGGDGFTFEFNTGDGETIDCIMVHVRGGGDSISALLQFSVPNGWTLLDCSTSEFIDPKKPSQDGWEGFQAYRDKIVRENPRS
jgi:hypothetical protein